MTRGEVGVGPIRHFVGSGTPDIGVELGGVGKRRGEGWRSWVGVVVGTSATPGRAGESTVMMVRKELLGQARAVPHSQSRYKFVCRGAGGVRGRDASARRWAMFLA